MAFNADYFTWVQGGGPAHPKLGIYKTDDTAATVDTAGYFPTTIGARVGDIIKRVTVTNLGASNEAVATFGEHIVVTASATSVDVTDTTAGTVTNTD